MADIIDLLPYSRGTSSLQIEWILTQIKPHYVTDPGLMHGSTRTLDTFWVIGASGVKQVWVLNFEQVRKCVWLLM